MTDTIAHLDRELLLRERLDRLLDALEGEIGGAALVGVEKLAGKSNDVFQLGFDDGRVLVVKRARSTMAAGSFATSRLASRLLRERGEVAAPAHLDVPPGLVEMPALVYWRIQLPILKELWPGVPEAEQPDVMRRWGALFARIHRVRLPGYGPIGKALHGATPLAVALEEHLAVEQRPIYAADWPVGVPALDRLTRAVPRVGERSAARRGAVLVHGDLHMENVLCERGEDGLTCVGVLDLESAFAGPPEADLMRPLVLYGPGFGDLPRPLLDALVEGYGAELDPVLLTFYHALHLLNLGLHCARRGLDEFAGYLARGAEQAIDTMRREDGG